MAIENNTGNTTPAASATPAPAAPENTTPANVGANEQFNDVDFFGGLFEDEDTAGQNQTEDETSPTSEENAAAPPDGQTEEKPADGQHQTEDAESFLAVKYNGEEVSLSRDKAVEFAQKGMNYDKLMQRTNERISLLEAELSVPRGEQNILGVVAGYARAVGQTPEQLMQHMQGYATQNGIDIQSARPDVGKYRTQKMQEDWKDFLSAYPDIKDPEHDLSPEVWEGIKSGLTPRQAMIEANQKRHGDALAAKDAEIATLKAENAALKKNNENKQKSPGSVAPKGGGANDPFLEGLLG